LRPPPAFHNGAHRNDEFFADAWCCRNGWASLAGKSRFEASYCQVVFMTCIYESVIQSVFTAMETARNSG
jgi:hypothetical protein